jgi:predicted ribosomally synthesized peptide with SipW-like signal peptide
MTRKILYSLLIIGAVLLAFGAITFAVFSDNTGSDIQEFAAGTVDINVNGQQNGFDTELDMEKMEAGDCETDTFVVTNTGTLPVNLWSWTYTYGDIFSCDPNPDCNMYVKMTPDELADSDATPNHLEASGGTETFDVEACLPLCAGNGCQAKTGKVRFYFHAVQASNLEDFECVKLEDKEPPTWFPKPLTPPHGNLCYKVDGSDLEVVVNAYGLTPDTNFQLDLTGGDMNDPEDAACTPQDDSLAAMSSDLYEAGYWNWGTVLEGTCNSSNGGEGVWNYAGVYGGVESDGTGAISYAATLSGLPGGSYVVKAHVKEIIGTPPGTAWPVVLSEVDYIRFTIP